MFSNLALIGAGDQSVKFLEKQFNKGAAGPDIEKLVKQLDSDQFRAREPTGWTISIRRATTWPSVWQQKNCWI